MPRDHRRPEGFARVCAAVPPTHMSDVLRNSEQTIDRGRRVYCRVCIAWERKVLWNELDLLTGGRPTLTCGGDRRLSARLIATGGRDASLCRTAAEADQQAEHAHGGTTQSRSAPLEAPVPGLQSR